MENYTQILNFWEEAGPKKWFSRDEKFDETIKQQFSTLHEQAIKGEIDSWKNKSDSCLALILLLDQFSRNMFRQSANAFAQDDKALQIAKFALNENFPDNFNSRISDFFYLPFMHSECIEDQKTSIRLQHMCNKSDGIGYAITHFEIIERFGRFPHRNSVLGRHTTPAEQIFLEGGGFKG